MPSCGATRAPAGERLRGRDPPRHASGETPPCRRGGGAPSWWATVPGLADRTAGAATTGVLAMGAAARPYVLSQTGAAREGLTLLVEQPVEALHLVGGHRVAVLGLRVAALSHLAGERLEATHHLVADPRVALHEARRVAVVDAEQVVEDEHLAVGGWAGADSDHRNLDVRHERLGQLARDRLEDDREAARPLELARGAVHLERPLRGAALGAIPTEGGGGLGRQADVAHHRDPRLHDRPGAVGGGAAALELHGVAARLLYEALGGRDGLLVRHLVGSERKVPHEQRRAEPAAGGGGQHEHLLERHGHGAGVAEHGHGRRVANEDDVYTGRLGHLGARVVVGGDHHDRLAERLLLGQLGERHRPALCWRGVRAHEPPRMVLSMSRARPTRAATASSVEPLTRSTGERSSAERSSRYSGAKPAASSSPRAASSTVAASRSPSATRSSAARSARLSASARSRSSALR